MYDFTGRLGIDNRKVIQCRAGVFSPEYIVGFIPDIDIYNSSDGVITKDGHEMFESSDENKAKYPEVFKDYCGKTLKINESDFCGPDV